MAVHGPTGSTNIFRAMGVAIAYRWRWYSWWRVEMVAGGDGGGSGGGTGSGDVVMACGGDEKWHGEGQGGVLGDLHNRQ